MTVLSIKPRNDELNIYQDPSAEGECPGLWWAHSRTVDGSTVCACGDSPENALERLRHGCGDNLAPYSMIEYQEAVRALMTYKASAQVLLNNDTLPNYIEFALVMEQWLGNVKPENRPFGYWDRWLTLARHALEVVQDPRMGKAGRGVPAFKKQMSS